MKNINERCPFNTECGRRKCFFELREAKCPYYSANAMPGNEIEDQMEENTYLPEEMDFLNAPDEEEAEELNVEESPINGIVMININRIYPHPDNPRKDIGDVSELAASIKESGLMQNLTVVPKNDSEYTVIIGHRRLAASRLAGLTEVPCAVRDMSEKEQLATMLAENMQRVDLTIPEQAEGIQMMLDFGESFEDIAKSTGLSESTVRRRAKIAKYGKDKLDVCFGRGATLFDFEEIDSIEDPEWREKLLDAVGTKDFDWKLRSAKSAAEVQVFKKAVEERVSKWAEFSLNEPEEEYETVACYSFYGYKDKVDSIPEEAPSEGELIYYTYSSGVQVVRLLTEEELAEEDEKDFEEEKRLEEKARKRETLLAIAKNAYERRKEFIVNFASADKFGAVVVAFAIWVITRGEYKALVASDVEEVYGQDVLGKFMNGEFPILESKALLLTAYCKLYDSERETFHNVYMIEHRGNAKLSKLYSYLQLLGYEMADEEEAWMNGTHEVFKGQEE